MKLQTLPHHGLAQEMKLQAHPHHVLNLGLGLNLELGLNPELGLNLGLDLNLHTTGQWCQDQLLCIQSQHSATRPNNMR